MSSKECQKLHDILIDPKQSDVARIQACRDLDKALGVTGEPNPDWFDVVEYCDAYSICPECGRDCNAPLGEDDDCDYCEDRC